MLVILLVSGLVIAACGAEAGNEVTTTSAETEATGPLSEVTTTTVSTIDDEVGTAATAFDEFNALAGQERHDALVAAAQEEGLVVFYTASAGMDPVIEAFEDTYDIPVDLFVGQSETVLQRILQEYQAGFHGVDVHDDHEAFTVAHQGLAYEYVNSELTDDIPGYDAATNVAATRVNVYTQGWNTDLVSEDELPETLDGFTDPKWEGRLSIDPRDWRWYIGVSDYYINEQDWTQEQVDEMFKTLSSYSSLHEGHVVQGDMLLAGEFDTSLTVYTQNIDRTLEADPDAPVAWKKSDGSWIDPLIFTPAGATLLKNAPHPAAAMLFVDFLLTEGQQILALEDRTPTAIAQPGGPLEGIPNEDLHQVDFEKSLLERDDWTTRWDELLRGS